MTFFGPLWERDGRKDSAMSVSIEPGTYRSPRHKLLGFFVKSRDGWKAKCLAAKRKAKALANNVAALRKSRAQWKTLARERGDEIRRLQQELEEAKNNPA
jgi:hypothetical protein